MNITPLDLKKNKFKKGMFGYNKEEVDSFMEMLVLEYENIISENGRLREKVKFAEEKLTEYKDIEKTLKETLIATQKNSEELKDRAQEQSDLIIQKADQKSNEILSQAKEKLLHVQQEVNALRRQKEEIYWNVYNFLQTQLSILNSNFKTKPESKPEEEEIQPEEINTENMDLAQK